MPGFSFYYKAHSIKFDRQSDLITDNFVGVNYEVNRFTINKFMNDKVFFENENFIIVLEGVVVNKSELLEKHKESSWSKLIIKLYNENAEFFREFRGSFSGIIYDKTNDKWNIFTDQLGTKHLYYYRKEKSIVISSEIGEVYEYLKNSNSEYDLDVESAYNLLSYGYMLKDDTLSVQIKKLKPGSYIKIEKDVLTINEYYRLPLASSQTNLSEPEIINKLDDYFRMAVKRQFDKDIEYGYKHLVALSGGLDSRMTSWVAHDIGYTNQLNLTFSQSDYLDETVPKKIAADLKHEWIFKALDNGLFLKDLDEVNKMTGGNVLYYGLAHGNSMLKLINCNDLGVFHSGQLGDVVIGSFINSFSPQSLKNLSGAYSKKMLMQEDFKLEKKAEEIEIELIYRRGLNGANNGLLAIQNYTETLSPFYDLEFFEYCLSIPIKYRMNHNIYFKWILAKYPEAAEYVWENTGKKINRKEIYIKYKGRRFSLEQFFSAILFKLGLKEASTNTKNHMNPLDYWYSTNEDIKVFQDEYFKTCINLISDNKLKDDCKELYKTGTAMEKNQVLTLLSAIKLFLIA